MNAINTKILTATRTKGAHVKAFNLQHGHTVTIPWPGRNSVEETHFAALKAFLEQYPLGDPEDWVSGAVKDGRVWVYCDGGHHT